MSKLFFVCLAALFAIAIADEVKFEDCGSGEVKKVIVDGCSGDECKVVKGQPLKFSAKLHSKHASKKVKVHVKAGTDGVEIEVPGVEHDGCKVITCPVVADKDYTFEYTFQVPKALPSVKGYVLVKATGDNNTTLACAKVKGELVDNK